jgi:hypothetical protein
MDPKYYCESMYAELTGMKARLYDILRVIDQMPVEARARIRPQTSELHILVGDLSRRIDRLMTECPADWSKAKMEIEELKEQLVEKINWWDATHIAGGYLGG